MKEPAFFLRLVVVGFMAVLAWPLAASAGTVSQCVICHTNPGILIPAVRECLEHSRGLPSGSAQTEGEG